MDNTTLVEGLSNSLVINYIDYNSQSKKLTLKYINPEASNLQLLTWSKMYFRTFSAATYVSTQRIIQGTLYNLEVS